MNFKALIFIGVLIQAAVVFGRREWRTSLKSEQDGRKITDPNYFRLPRSVIPKTYDLRLVPVMDVGNLSFTGTVQIVLYVQNSTKSITLHSKGLNVTEHTLTAVSSPSTNISLENVTDYKDRDFHVLYLTKTLTKGDYNLTMNFKGMLQEDLDGFYICSYENETGGTERMAVTQFESISARKAFPCFDEPSFKANFTVSIARPKNMVTLSNMPLQNTTNSSDLPPGYVMDQYLQSPKMSTYLVAFAVSKFQANPPDAGEIFRVWSRKNAISQTNYSVEVGPKILKKMTEITKINYTLPKMDLLAVPDFAAGAMENWGLVTFRETDLLFLDKISTNYDRQQVITVVAHELSHQWFGDLVTTEWWSNLWLNEGFAEYWMYVVTDLIEPTWRLMEQFVLDNMQTPFISDAMEFTMPIVHPVLNPNIGDYSSSDITYGKGSSIIRMMECVLTRDVFFKGLRRYLEQRKFSTANQSMLFDAIQAEAVGTGALPPYVSVGDVWSSWTTQSGYPLVTVQRIYKEGKAVIEQERFVLEDFNFDKNQQWWIPLTYTTDNATDFNITRAKDWMSTSDSDIVVDIPVDAGWVIFNIQATGYYRVNYDEQNWRLIIACLTSKNYTKIHPVNRGQLLDDALSLARGGYINYTLALDLSKYLAQETDFIPWYTAYNLIDFLDMLLSSTGYYVNFQVYMNLLLKAQYKMLTFNESSSDVHVTRLSRSMMLPRACKYDVGDCVKEAVSQFHQWNTTKENTIPANLRSAVYCYGVLAGGKDAWDFLWKAYDNTTIASERARIMEALACSTNNDIINGYLEETVKVDSKIRLQDRATVFKNVYNRLEGLPVAINFVTSRYSDIVNTCGADTATGIVLGISKRVSSSKDAFKDVMRACELEIGGGKDNIYDYTTLRSYMLSFLGMSQNSIDESSIEKSKKYINNNLNWLLVNEKTVGKWLKKNAPTGSSGIHQASLVLIALATILSYQFN